ncbi:hypothetical protein, partial [Aquisalimonas sp.]
MKKTNAIIAASIAAVFGLGMHGMVLAENDNNANADNASAAASGESTASADSSNSWADSANDSSNNST